MKLVRDKIPEIIKNKGKNCIWRTATQQEMYDLLKQKLTEEVKEYLESDKTEELADILEVIHALAKQSGADMAEIEQARIQKKQERGAFDRRIVLESWEQ